MRPLYLDVPKIYLTKGDSSGKYVLSSKLEDFTNGNWTCTMTLKLGDIEGDPVITRNIYPEPEGFIFGLIPSDTKNLEIGEYFWVVELKNPSLLYNREIFQVPLYLGEEGID